MFRIKEDTIVVMAVDHNERKIAQKGTSLSILLRNESKEGDGLASFCKGYSMRLSQMKWNVDVCCYRLQ